MKQLITILKEIKTYSSRDFKILRSNIYAINVSDGRYDNNMFVRAKNEEEAKRIAPFYADYLSDDARDDNAISIYITSSKNFSEYDLENWKEMVEDYKVDTEIRDFLKGKTDGYLYSAGS